MKYQTHLSRPMQCCKFAGCGSTLGNFERTGGQVIVRCAKCGRDQSKATQEKITDRCLHRRPAN